MQLKRSRRLFSVFLFYSVGTAACLSLLAGGAPVSGQTKTKAAKTQPQSKATKIMNTSNDKASPFACDMSALTKEQRTRIFSLLAKMKASIQEVKELPDGFGFRFSMESAMLMEISEFITYERLCCPFFDFELVIEREGGPLCLRLKGREGVKDFIRIEFGL